MQVANNLEVKVTMSKYGIDMKAVQALVDQGETVEAAMEKVASSAPTPEAVPTEETVDRHQLSALGKRETRPVKE